MKPRTPSPESTVFVITVQAPTSPFPTTYMTLNIRVNVSDIYRNTLKPRKYGWSNFAVRLVLACHRAATYQHLDPRQASNLGHRWIQYLIFASGVPRESPPPLRRNNGTVSDIRHDPRRRLRDSLRRCEHSHHGFRHSPLHVERQEGVDDQRQSVSVVRALFHYRMNKWSLLPRVKAGQ